jgi:hypothetical protein
MREDDGRRQQGRGGEEEKQSNGCGRSVFHDDLFLVEKLRDPAPP